MRRWICLLVTTSLVIAAFTAVAAAQTGLEGRSYRFPGAEAKEPAPDDESPQQVWPVIAFDSLADRNLLFELEVASDGTWYYLTGRITNIAGEPERLSYANPGTLPYFRIYSGDHEVWSSRYTGPSAQVIVVHSLEPGEAKVYTASWKGQDKQGYGVDAGPVFIEFVQRHYGWGDGVIACPDVPLLPAGTGWLPPDLSGLVPVDSWEAAALSSLLAEHVLPGYPEDYFTSQARTGREVALAAAVLMSPSVAGELSEEQYQLACDLADAVGV